MASITPIPQSGLQGALFTTMRAGGVDVIPPGTNTVFFGVTLVGNLQLTLPDAHQFAPGVAITLKDAINAVNGNTVYLIPQSFPIANTLNGGNSPLAALPTLGPLEVFSDGNGNWNFTANTAVTGNLAGNTAGTLAAGNDTRILHAPRAVSSVAALRALPVPVSGVDSGRAQTANYWDGLTGGGNNYQWSATNTDSDNGGTVIALAANGLNPGRYLAWNYNTSSMYASQFGANPGASPTQNRIAIQAAHDALPPLQTYWFSATNRVSRFGRLKIDNGNYPIDGCLYFGGCGVRVEGGGVRSTTLRLASSTIYTDPTNPFWLVNFEPVAYQLEGDGSHTAFDLNNNFGSEVDGINVDCANNPGSSGLYLNGAQGMRIGAISVNNFGVNGIYFGGVEAADLNVGGAAIAKGPSLIIAPGVQNMVIHHASIEHQNTVCQYDSSGNPVPTVLIQGVSSLVINQIEGESSAPTGGETFCLIKDSSNINIHSIGTNQFNSSADGTKVAITCHITGDSGNVQLGHVYRVGGVQAGTIGKLVKDDSVTGGFAAVNYVYPPDVNPGSVPGYTTYRQSSVVHQLTADALTLGGLPVVAGDVFTTNGYTSANNGHQRLHLKFGGLEGYSILSTCYVVHIHHYSGLDTVALVTASKAYQGSVTVLTTVLSGPGMLVNVTGGVPPGGPVDPSTPILADVTFSTIDANPTGYSATVSRLGYNGSAFEANAQATWTAEPETISGVMDGSAVPNVLPPAPTPVVQINTFQYPAIVGNPSRFIIGAVPAPASLNLPLPRASTYAPGSKLEIADIGGYTSSSHQIIVTADQGDGHSVPADILHGSAVFTGAAFYTFVTDGVGAWVAH